jgi:formiminotetrahydrofolate cyclodeaminase
MSMGTAEAGEARTARHSAKNSPIDRISLPFSEGIAGDEWNADSLLDTQVLTVLEIGVALSTLSMIDYARKLASAAPTPGGGSASAVVGALGAGLIAMVARLTGASPKFAAVAARMRAIADEASGLSDSFIAAIDEDVAAFEKVGAAYKLPKSTEAEQKARTAAIQAALVVASDPPMRVIELCVRVAQLAVELVDVSNPNAISDAGCAALFGQAAARGAALNVRINIKSLKDPVVAQSYEMRLDDMLAQIGLLAEVAVVKVERVVLRDAPGS